MVVSHAKDRVFGVIDGGKIKAYTFESFPQAGVIEDVFSGQNLIIAGSKPANYLMAFVHPNDGRSFSAITGTAASTNVVMEDDEGNQYDIFGRVVSGPRSGEELTTANGFIGYWFSWIAFYPDVEIFQ